MSNTIHNQCGLRLINVDPSTGCTLTRATITGMTPEMFESTDTDEVRMDQIIARAREARFAGVTENTLEDLLMSRMENVRARLNKVSENPSESIILPYIYRRQERAINSNYFLVEAGAAAAGAGANGIPASAWTLTLKQSNSPWSTALLELHRYFLVGTYVYIEWFNSTTKAAYSTTGKVVSSVDASTDGVTKAAVTIEPNVAADTWAGYDSSAKLPYQPQTGALLPLANSVSDYESWCNNHVAENPNKLLVYWLQTSRETHEYNDEYLAALNSSLTSGYWKTFKQLPLARQKAIMHQKHVREMLNSAFYGQVINDKQTADTYRQLPQVVDPLNPNCTLEYKSNALGLMTQLSDCTRMWDSASGNAQNALNLDVVAAYAYELKRHREARGGSVDTIDLMTDRWTAGSILQAFSSYYHDKYDITTSREYRSGEALKFENQVLANYHIYQLPPDKGGMNIAVFHNPFFDDRLQAFAASVSSAAPSGELANRGRAIWAIDWTDVRLGIAGTKSVQRKTNEADNLYNCIIKPNIRHYMLTSTQWTVEIEDPNRHFVFRNFTAAAPTLT